ncbi:type I secretion system permease/ATPase [Xanthobacter sp. V4C-4]|uniref:type I secretion system permease/ATPase n=1 Tax=Xanthobacter cornucopiae TaxID=3119924 RepID=UPI0037262265
MFRLPVRPLDGAAPLPGAVAAARRHLPALVAFSFATNLLALNGSLYMMQVYDRVLVSRSIPTLVTVTGLMVALYLLQGLIDGVRQRMMARLAQQFESRLRGPALAATLTAAAAGQAGTSHPLRDLDTARAALAGGGLLALIDLPFVPLFVGLVFLIHPALGVFALAGATCLVTLTILADRLGRRPAGDAMALGARKAVLLDDARRNAETVLAMGLLGAVDARHATRSRTAGEAQCRVAEVVGGFGIAARTGRMLLQSLLLGLGAFLLIRAEISAGAILASTIVVGRALAPVDLAIANWRGLVDGRAAFARLKAQLAAAPAPATALPAPRATLTVDGLAAGGAASAPVLAQIDFALQAGDALAVLGSSGAGKSTLARALAGVLAPHAGTIRLDGATLDQWAAAERGRHIGYVAQGIGLFDGSIAENIARMAPAPDSAAVIAAARAAGLHDFILRLPAGYDTPAGEAHGALSAGQRQRLALARALYGDPFLLVMDEPNSNLDAAGDAALAAAVRAARARGAVVVLITHRPAAVSACNKVLILEDGRQRAFGPRDAVLRPAAVARPAA